MLPGRAITSAELQEATVLLVRSITKINADLLDGTGIQFVGSASAGIDHVDTAYLKDRGLGFASSPGCNANSVAEYVVTALLILAVKNKTSLAGKTIGIVGVGNIGKLVKTKAETLGLQPILCDPPRADNGELPSCSLEKALSCDIVTLHVPLTRAELYPTHHLINKDTLTWLKPSTIFINASRGEVVETKALIDAIQHNRIGPTVLDVWEHEPNINWKLFEAVTLATPHIAGHSLDGKAMGTFMIYSALCKHLGVDLTWNPSHSLPDHPVPSINIGPTHESVEETLKSIVTKVYDLEADHYRMKELLAAPNMERATLFDGLRKHYPIRREFHGTTVHVSEEIKKLQQILDGLGFVNG